MSSLCRALAERCVKAIAARVRDRCEKELTVIDEWRAGDAKAAGKPKPVRCTEIPLDDKPFIRMTYDEAIAALEQSGRRFHSKPEWGKRLATEHEQWLSGTYCGGRPVFVMHFPVQAASFYARRDDTSMSKRGPTAATFDLLTSAGELVGGGIREERADQLEARMVHPRSRVSLSFLFTV